MRRVTTIQKESRSGQGYLSHENCESPLTGANRMRALLVHELAGPDALWVDDVPIPPRPDGDPVLIEVAAAGIGFVDTLVARGRYQVRQQPPYVPGLELAGVVREAPDNTGLSVGQAVIATVPAGACAETAWAPAAFTARLPDGLTPVQGAGMVVNAITAVK